MAITTDLIIEIMAVTPKSGVVVIGDLPSRDAELAHVELRETAQVIHRLQQQWEPSPQTPDWATSTSVLGQPNIFVAVAMPSARDFIDLVDLEELGAVIPEEQVLPRLNSRRVPALACRSG